MVTNAPPKRAQKIKEKWKNWLKPVSNGNLASKTLNKPVNPMGMGKSLKGRSFLTSKREALKRLRKGTWNHELPK